MADAPANTDPKDPKDPKDKKIEELEGKLDQISNNMNQITNALTQVASKQQELEQNPPRNVQPPTGDGTGKGDDPMSLFGDADLETLPTKDLVQGIFKGVSQMLDSKVQESLQPVQEKLTSHVQTAEQQRVREEYESLKKEDPNVDQWLQEVKELHSKHPDLSFGQLYTLAKSSDPEKAKKLDEANRSKDEETGRTKSPDENFQDMLFGGIGGSQGSPEGEARKDKSVDEAAEDAFSSVFGAQAGA